MLKKVNDYDIWVKLLLQKSTIFCRGPYENDPWFITVKCSKHGKFVVTMV